MDEIYDRIRKATYNEQIRNLAKGKQLSMKPARCLAVKLIKPISDRAYSQAESIKNHYLDPLAASSAINVFQWFKARLTLEQPEKKEGTPMLSVSSLSSKSPTFTRRSNEYQVEVYDLMQPHMGT